MTKNKQISDIDFAIELLCKKRANCINKSPMNLRILDAINSIKKLKEDNKFIVNFIKNELKEFKEKHLCSNYDTAQDQVNKNLIVGADNMFDVGRFEVLSLLLDMLEGRINKQIHKI